MKKKTAFFPKKTFFIRKKQSDFDFSRFLSALSVNI